MRTLVAMLVLGSLVIGACGRSERAAAAASTRDSVPAEAAPRIAAETSFHGLWWSDAQMEGLDPDAPPPKRTDVRLTRWESSDPVGSPHPDTVNAVIVLRNNGSTSAELAVTVDAEWNEGTLADSASSTWSAPATLRTIGALLLTAGAADTLRVPVPVGSRTAALFARQRWPHALRVTITVRGAAVARPLVREQAVLPILLGT